MRSATRGSYCGFALGEQLAVPGPALGGREAAGGVDRGDLGERRAARSPRSARRPPRSARRLRSKARGDGRHRAPSSISVRRHREAPARAAAAPASAHARGRPAPRAAATASRTERVIAQTVSSVGRQRHGAVGRRQPRRVLEADQALQRGRDADRAAGVGAERGPGGAGGDRDRAARGRAARECAASASSAARRRVGGRAVVRVDADAGERELATCWCGRSAPRRRGAGARRRGSRARPAARRAATAEPAVVGSPCDVEQVLDRDRQAGERPGSARRRAIGRVGARARPCARGVEACATKAWRLRRRRGRRSTRSSSSRGARRRRDDLRGALRSGRRRHRGC